jgi:HlyD family type I secretion membrane fusion protein
MLQMERDRETAIGGRARSAAEIGRIELTVTEQELLIEELGNRRREDVAAELREVETELSDLRERVAAARDVAARTRIAAPAAGTVMGVRVFTPGGVVEPGEPLLEIVPAGDRLIVEARVAPNNRDSVEVGLPAEVRLPAFSQLGAPRLTGEVIRVSADRFADGQMAWYEARIALDPDQPALAELPLTPGMAADVLIVTGERTLLDYLLAPIAESLGRALRDE